MIYFVLDEWTEAEYQKIAKSFFELGLRIGIPFSIGKTAPSDAFKIIYSKTSNLDDPCVFPSAFDSLSTIYDDEFFGPKTSAGNIDVVKGSYDLISFSHEVGEYDSMGRLIPKSNPLVRGGSISISFLDNNAEYLKRFMIRAGMPRFETLKPWNKPVISMTHDVDGPQLHSFFATFRSAFLGLIKRDTLELDSFVHSLITRLYHSTDPYWNFEACLELGQHLGYKPTFYFYSADKKRHIHDPRYNITKPEFQIIKCLQEAGCEIGIHFGIEGHSIDSYQRVRNDFNQLYKIDPCGGRSHYWVLPEPLRCYENMDKAGLVYDVSLNAQCNGFRNGTSFPLTPSIFWRGLKKPYFLALPSEIMDAYLVPRYREYPGAYSELKNIMSEIKKNGGIATLDWHIRSFHNNGAFQGFLSNLHRVFNLFPEVDYMTPREITEKWNIYIDKIFKGENL